MLQLQPYIHEFYEKGASLRVIGSGRPEFIAGFRETTKYEGEVYTDPSLAVFAQAKLVRSVLATIGPRSLGNAIGNMRRGQRQGKTRGDVWQQGGALIISRDGVQLFSHQSTAGGDNVSPQSLLSALD